MLAGWLLASAPLVPAAAPAEPGPGELQPYTARYQVSYRGLAGGQIEASLKPGPEPHVWLYETRAFPNFLGKMAISPSARERSTMEVSPAGVRPLEFEFNDGSAEEAKDIRVRFDWAAGRVTGVADGEEFAYDVKPGTQDTASIQAAMMVELLAGRTPAGFPILTGGKLRDYRYWSEGTGRITTPAGPFDTVIWASQRDGSSRVSRVWHAPSLGFVPVQAIQYRKGRAEFSMKLANLTRP
jgi:Protein of unknown function (DUF3108)